MKRFLPFALLITLCICISAQGQSAKPQQRQVVIVFNGPINDLSVSRLIVVVDEKIKQGATALTLLINSSGGGVDAALAGYNYLRGIPVTITTHNFGIVDSAAVMLYSAGSKRLATPDSRFVLHGIMLTFQTAVDENQIGEYTRLLQLQTDTMATVIAKTTGKTQATVKAAFVAKTVLGSDVAREWGLVTAIESRLYESGAEVTIVPMQ